eukprot:1656512-Rhodomonas_salina.1
MLSKSLAHLGRNAHAAQLLASQIDRILLHHEYVSARGLLCVVCCLVVFVVESAAFVLLVLVAAALRAAAVGVATASFAARDHAQESLQDSTQQLCALNRDFSKESWEKVCTCWSAVALSLSYAGHVEKALSILDLSLIHI